MSHDFRLISQVANEIYEVNKVGIWMRILDHRELLVQVFSLSDSIDVRRVQGVHRFEGDIIDFKEHLRKTHAALADK